MLPEFVFIGRSNVGKSSLLNALTDKPALAKVSGTPGKTQLLNVFLLETFYMLDLPGYGYAKTSHVDRKAYRRLLERTIQDRTNLTGVVWLLDIRHPPSKEDVDFQDLLSKSGKPVLPVLTKLDKVKRAAQHATIKQRSVDLGIPVDQLQPVSIKTREGLADLGEAILGAVADETNIDSEEQ